MRRWFMMSEVRNTVHVILLRNKLLGFVIVSCAAVVIAQSARAAPEAETSRRPVTVADAIAMVRAADSLHFKNIAHFSPDGSKIVIVLRRGDVERNTNDFFIDLWDTNDVFGSTPPKVLLHISTSSNEDAISNVTWLDDNETVAFLGETVEDSKQVFTFNVRTHVMRQVTNDSSKIYSYSINGSGDTVAYIAESPAASIFNDDTVRHGLVVVSQDISDVLRGRAEKPSQLFVQSGSNAPRLIQLPNKLADFAEPFLSPNGRYVVVPVYANQIPDAWAEYSEPYIQAMARQKPAPGQSSILREYMWVDTLTGQNGIALEVPGISIAWRVAWSPDSRSIAIGNTYLPLGETQGEERRSRQRSTFTVEVELPSGKLNKIAPKGLELLSWDATTSRLMFGVDSGVWSAGGSEKRIYFQKLDGRWTEATGLPGQRTKPSVFVEQSMNTPPRIVVLNPSTNQRRILLDLNPQFNNLRFARVDEIKFTTRDGKEVKAGLYYPVDYTPGRRYPLVIQTHDWSADMFWIDGPYTTAFAAQPLAGRGIMVLQLGMDEDKVGSLREGPEETAKFEDAITYLNQKGLIDRSRVGVIGFSRSCFHVKYALTHSRFHFAAASVTDGFDGGFLQYIVSLPSNQAFAAEEEDVNGGPPFGLGLKFWINRSPDFSLDKVQAPLRIYALSSESTLGEWEWFAGLSRLGKAVEMVVTKDGSHLLERPWDRMISQQGNVDWFCFWLKDEEDPDPAKRDQYLRWRNMRRHE